MKTSPAVTPDPDIGDMHKPAPTGIKRPCPGVHVQEDSAQPKKRKQEAMDSYTVKTTSSQKGNLDEAVARFFFACNIPFSRVEHPTFKHLIELLHHTHLDNVYTQLTDNMQEKLKGKVVTIVEDGWSNIHNV